VFSVAKIRMAGLAVLAAAAILPAAAGVPSCAATATNVPIRSFQDAQKVDVVCLRVNDNNGNALPWSQIEAVPQNECAQVPPNVTGSTLPNHLYALVTQTTRGQLAAVDLTAGNIVDEDKTTPGTNFIPVGANPTDVAVGPDARLTFVSSADPKAPALYSIANTRVLGDSTGQSPPPPLRLSDLVACRLPQAPMALTMASAPAADAGVAEGGAGDAADAGPSSYSVVVLLRDSVSGTSAKVVTIDPTPMAAAWAGAQGGGLPPGAGQLPACSVLGAMELSPSLPASWVPGPTWPDGVPYADAGNVTPGVAGCASDAGIMSGEAGTSEPPDAEAGGAAEDGAGDDGGPSSDASADDAAGSPDAGEDRAGDDGGGEDGSLADGAVALASAPMGNPHPMAMVARDDLPIVYVSDSVLPVVHVIDLSNPSSPTELPPLLATSALQPTRRVSVSGLAISPPTRDYKRYLYAIDASDGSLMVYDVSEPRPAAPASPMRRPHAELNPFASPDRLSFSAPVATLAFVKNDWPVLPSKAANGSSASLQVAYTGVLCNPNPNANPTDGGAPADLGAYYRADQAMTIQNQGIVQNFPDRLRGVFAFVTLTNGNMVAIDVDDWDAPCRRPDPMEISPGDAGLARGVWAGMTGVLDLPEPEPGDAADLDPFHAPTTYQGTGASAVTQEAFFPVSAPNRMRSSVLLRDDQSNGNHIPNLPSTPQLFDMNNTPASGSGRSVMLPTPLAAGFVDPTYIQNPTAADPSTYTTNAPGLESAAGQAVALRDAGASSGFLPGSSAVTPGVRLAFDDPTVHADQDWTVTYEGALPAATGLVANMASTPGGAAYSSVTLTAMGASLCERGIEDWSIGQSRARRVVAEMQCHGLPPPKVDLSRWTSDYIEITDDLLPSNDTYWSIASAAMPDAGGVVDDCWSVHTAGSSKTLSDAPGFPSTGQSPRAQDRYIACQQQFGSATDADTHLARDFPIVNAFDDHLVIGRFGFSSSSPVERTASRVVVGPDPSNADFLKLATCCFHRQIGFKVRTGGEWVAVGQSGLLHKVVVDKPTNACVLSTDPRKALLNARAFDVPWSDPGDCKTPTLAAPFDRDSPLAMRNPFFSFVMWAGCGPPVQAEDHTLSTRDLTWRFSTRGGFSPLTVSLAGTTGAQVIPESMRFISSLGQLAVVDGAQQGLMLIDLHTVAFAHNPYF